MVKQVVFLAYDLATPPGLHDRFREEMKKRNWRFEHGSKDLPETTCYAIFKETILREEAVRLTRATLAEVSEILKKEKKDFKIKRRLILAMDQNHFDASLLDLG